MENIKSFDALAKERETIYNVNTPIMFSDDTYMIYKDDFVLLKVEEANTEFLKENFEIEVFKREEVVKKDAKGNLMTGSYSEVLKQLFFEGDNVKDEDRVDYYFDINFDFEIDEEEYCKLSRDEDKVKNITSTSRIAISLKKGTQDDIGRGDLLTNKVVSSGKYIFATPEDNYLGFKIAGNTFRDMAIGIASLEIGRASCRERV